MTADTPPTFTTPIETYQQATTGSISGFNSVTLVNDPTFGESDSSAAAITQQIANLVSEGIPSHLKQCIALIQSHETDYNNPHKDTFSSISLESSSMGNTAVIFNRIIKGTVPLAPPVCSMSAKLDLSSPLLGVTCERDSPLTIVNAQGVLETLPANTLRADYSFGSPTYPCWTNVTQYLDPPNVSTNTNFSLTGGTLGPAGNGMVLPLLDSESQTTLVNNGTFSKKQITYTSPSSMTLTTGQEYCFSVFIYPFNSNGTFYLRANDYFFYVDLINLNTQFPFNTTTNGTIPIGSVTLLPSGWIRLGISFILKEEPLTVDFGFDPNRYGSLEDVKENYQANAFYSGTNGVNIFGVCYPQLTNVSGLAPVITTASTLAPTTLTYAGNTNASSLSNFIGKVKFIPFTSLNSDAVYNVCNFNNAFQVTQSQDSTTYTLQGHLTPNVFTESTVNGSSVVGTVSYNANAVSFLTSNMQQKITKNDFVGNPATPLPVIETLTMGPFRGYISECAHYAVDDDCNALALLVQE